MEIQVAPAQRADLRMLMVIHTRAFAEENVEYGITLYDMGAPDCVRKGDASR